MPTSTPLARIASVTDPTVARHSPVCLLLFRIAITSFNVNICKIKSLRASPITQNGAYKKSFSDAYFFYRKIFP
jgi:hypothetical protein